MNYKLLFKDATLTLFIQVIVAISGVAVMLLISREFGIDSYGEYYLVKRVSDVLWLFFLFGMTVSIPRNKHFVDVSKGTGTTEFIFVIFPLISLILYWASSDMLMSVFLKDFKSELGRTVSLLITGMIFYAMIISYFRAISKFVALNILTLTTFSIVPLISFLYTENISEYLRTYSVLILILNLLVYLTLSIQLIIRYEPFMNIKEKMSGLWDFLKYGIFRLPGLFLSSLLFTFPIVILNYLGTSEEIGSVGQMFQLFSIVSMPINALGVVLLPNFSKVIAEGNKISLQIFLRRGIKLVLSISFITALILSIFINELLYLINGEKVILNNLLIIRMFMYSLIPFAIYNFLRNPIDAAHQKPYSTILVILSFIISIVIAWIVSNLGLLTSLNLILFFTGINLLILGIGSCLFINKLYFMGVNKN